MISGKALCKAIRQSGYKPRSYSGRGMYGSECIGVTVDRGEECDLARNLGDYELGDEGETLPAPATDSMGLGVILYWPGIKWPKGERDAALD